MGEIITPKKKNKLYHWVNAKKTEIINVYYVVAVDNALL